MVTTIETRDSILMPPSTYLRRRVDDSDLELSPGLTTFIRVSLGFYFVLVIYLVYNNHFRSAREDDQTVKLQEIENKLKQDLDGISSSDAVANYSMSPRNQTNGPSCRLTIRSPNILALICFWHVRSKVLVNLQASKKTSRMSTFCLCLSLFLLWLGISMVIVCLSNWEEQGFILPVLLLFFVFVPCFSIYGIKSENWQNWEPALTATALGEALDGRIRSTVSSELLKGLEPLPTDHGEDRTSTPGFPSSTTFASLQRSGYASVTSWALYAAAIERIATTFPDSNDAVEFQKIHDVWFKCILPKAVSTFARFTDGLDDTRKRAMQRVRTQAIGIVTGGIGDMVNVGNDLREMRQMIKDMKGMVDDMKEIKQISNNASAVKVDDLPVAGDLVPHSGIHPVPGKTFLTGALMFLGMFGLLAISFFNIPSEKSTMAGLIVMAFAIGGVLIMYWMSRKHNVTHNAVEDMIDIEIRSRKTMEAMISKMVDCRPYITGEDKELIIATNGLRQVMMDNFYAALAMHTATQCMTFRGAHYGRNAPMLFPREEHP